MFLKIKKKRINIVFKFAWNTVHVFKLQNKPNYVKGKHNSMNLKVWQNWHPLYDFSVKSKFYIFRLHFYNIIVCLRKREATHILDISNIQWIKNKDVFKDWLPLIIWLYNPFLFSRQRKMLTILQPPKKKHSFFYNYIYIKLFVILKTLSWTICVVMIFFYSFIHFDFGKPHDWCRPITITNYNETMRYTCTKKCRFWKLLEAVRWPTIVDLYIPFGFFWSVITLAIIPHTVA